MKSVGLLFPCFFLSTLLINLDVSYGSSDVEVLITGQTETYFDSNQNEVNVTCTSAQSPSDDLKLDDNAFLHKLLTNSIGKCSVKLIDENGDIPGGSHYYEISYGPRSTIRVYVSKNKSMEDWNRAKKNAINAARDLIRVGSCNPNKKP